MRHTTDKTLGNAKQILGFRSLIVGASKQIKSFIRLIKGKELKEKFTNVLCEVRIPGVKVFGCNREISDVRYKLLHELE
ncbi:hypothetical protein Q31a_52950 [Aureliella helgolandensis]|uniref:Uncharacterized protein n=1 Tax=Aureliella helgolandensis TaxID=2527968 RepID=A0A518GE81_9BACT|nr:hypothetical protein Q31a_52950 [Aureliella helgolandensis]